MDIYVAKQENYKTHMHTIMKVYTYCNSWHNISNTPGIYHLRPEEEFHHHKTGFNQSPR